MPHNSAKQHFPTSLTGRCNHATSAHGQRLYNITANHAHDATAHMPGEGRAWDLLGRRFRAFSTTLRTLKRAEPNAPLRAKSPAQHHKQSHAIATKASSPLFAFVLTSLRCSHDYFLVGRCPLCMSPTQQGISELVSPLRFSHTPHASTALASPW